MKNVLKGLLFTIVTGIVGMNVANAASTARVECKDKYLKVGASTTCTVYATSDDINVTGFLGNIRTSQYLTISDVKPNTTLGFAANAAATVTNNIEQLAYSFTRTAGTGTITAATEFEVFSFKLTIANEAKNIAAGECGQMCLYGATLVGTSSVNATISNGTSCPTITIDTDADPKNPTTGAFANYLALIGCAGVAILTIAIVSKKNKFYRV